MSAITCSTSSHSWSDSRSLVVARSPEIDVGGNYVSDPTPAAPIAFSNKVVKDLGMSLRSCEDTLRGTVDSLIGLGVVTPRMKAKM